MNSVDTGWVTDEDPAARSDRRRSPSGAGGRRRSRRGAPGRRRGARAARSRRAAGLHPRCAILAAAPSIAKRRGGKAGDDWSLDAIAGRGRALHAGSSPCMDPTSLGESAPRRSPAPPRACSERRRARGSPRGRSARRTRRSSGSRSRYPGSSCEREPERAGLVLDLGPHDPGAVGDDHAAGQRHAPLPIRGGRSGASTASRASAQRTTGAPSFGAAGAPAMSASVSASTCAAFSRHARTRASVASSFARDAFLTSSRTCKSPTAASFAASVQSARSSAAAAILMAATSSRTSWAWRSRSPASVSAASSFSSGVCCRGFVSATRAGAWPTANDDDGPRFSELMSS